MCMQLSHADAVVLPQLQALPTPPFQACSTPEQLGRRALRAVEEDRCDWGSSACGRHIQSASLIQSPPHFTEREQEVLGLIADGLTNKAIARALGISVSTVKFHIRQLLGKLNAHSRTEAVVIAMRAQLLSN